MKIRKRKRAISIRNRETGEVKDLPGPVTQAVVATKRYVARFLEVETPELLVHEDVNAEVTDETFRGKFVKLAPRLTPSERDKFDGAGAASQIRRAGALAVVVAPVMVGEVQRVAPEKVAHRTPREAVQSWFGEQKGIAKDDRDAAIEIVFGFMDEEGL